MLVCCAANAVEVIFDSMAPGAPRPLEIPPEEHAPDSAPVPQPPDGPASFRGPLRYEIETASAQLEAGAPFSIFVRITNPYDIPVTILRVETLLPAEFKDPEVARPGLTKRVQAWAEEVEGPKPMVATPLGTLDSNNRDEPPERHVGATVLEPGNTALKKFTVKTRQVTFFSPALYTFHIEIRYLINGKENRDAVKQQFNIRSPLQSLVSGSFWGALAGASIHGLKDHLNDLEKIRLLPSVAAPIAGILIGAVVVVAFARKKDAQPFITIEDFYGGSFVGFIAGYVGFPILDTILPK